MKAKKYILGGATAGVLAAALGVSSCLSCNRNVAPEGGLEGKVSVGIVTQKRVMENNAVSGGEGKNWHVLYSPQEQSDSVYLVNLADGQEIKIFDADGDDQFYVTSLLASSGVGDGNGGVNYHAVVQTQDRDTGNIDMHTVNYNLNAKGLIEVRGIVKLMHPNMERGLMVFDNTESNAGVTDKNGVKYWINVKGAMSSTDVLPSYERPDGELVKYLRGKGLEVNSASDWGKDGKGVAFYNDNPKLPGKSVYWFEVRDEKKN